jgi:aminoglycoside 6'-N-acetyltransferase I
MKIRPYVDTDHPEWLRMRLELFPEHSAGDHLLDMEEWLSGPKNGVLVAERGNGRLGGFAEAGERNYADGCDTAPVAYLEAWYVDPDLRRQGVGAALVVAVEAWARERGYRELASDALLENLISQQAHLASGFEEVERSVKYRKSL